MWKIVREWILSCRKPEFHISIVIDGARKDTKQKQALQHRVLAHAAVRFLLLQFLALNT